MKEEKLFSAIITTYNRDVVILERALKSVLNQSYKNVETIIINDSPENIELANRIEDMVNKYISKSFNLKYYKLDKNSGACKARNIGLEMSKGEYIGFLDDDDEWKNNKVEELIKVFDQYPDAGLVYCNAIIVNDDDKTSMLRFKKDQPSGKIFEILLSKNTIGSCSFPVFKRQVIENVHGFREDMPALQDLELYLRISRQENCYYCPEPLVIYHVYNGERITRNKNKRIEAFEKINIEFRNDIIKDKKIMNKFYLFGSLIYGADGISKMSLQYYWMAIKSNWLNLYGNIYVFLKILKRTIVKKNNL